jgi:hypothetical protein
MPLIAIDNKRVDLTNDEILLYNKIVASYTSLTNNGEDLFMDLFETDDNGIIIFLRPPSKRQTSFEIFLFLMSIQQHQHLRSMHVQVSDICTQMKEKMSDIDKKMQALLDKSK